MSLKLRDNEKIEDVMQKILRTSSSSSSRTMDGYNSNICSSADLSFVGDKS
jgi:hypothetical protein